MKKLRWQFGESMEALDAEVKEIVGNVTVDKLLSELPAEILYDNAQDAKLEIRKLGDIVWQVNYIVYKSPKEKDFESVSILSTTQPSLLVALYEMKEELNKRNKKDKGNESY